MVVVTPLLWLHHSHGHTTVMVTPWSWSYLDATKASADNGAIVAGGAAGTPFTRHPKEVEGAAVTGALGAFAGWVGDIKTWEGSLGGVTTRGWGTWYHAASPEQSTQGMHPWVGRGWGPPEPPQHPPGHAQGAGARVQWVAAQADGSGAAGAARLCHIIGPAPGARGGQLGAPPGPHVQRVGGTPTGRRR